MGNFSGQNSSELIAHVKCKVKTLAFTHGSTEKDLKLA